MLRSGVLAVLAGSIFASPSWSDEPDEAEIPCPVTWDMLRGEWGVPKGGPVTLVFTRDKVTVTIASQPGGVAGPTTFVWDYEIEPKSNWVNLKPLAQGGGLGNAGLMSDGSLQVHFAPIPPSVPKTLRVTLVPARTKTP